LIVFLALGAQAASFLTLVLSLNLIAALASTGDLHDWLTLVGPFCESGEAAIAACDESGALQRHRHAATQRQSAHRGRTRTSAQNA